MVYSVGRGQCGRLGPPVPTSYRHGSVFIRIRRLVYCQKIAMIRRLSPYLADSFVARIFLLLACLSLFTQEAWAALPPLRGGRFALLISIANAPGQPRLPGGQRDIELARAVAKAAGVPDDNIFVLRDREASADGIRRALSELALRLAPADRVLIYLAGFGSRRPDTDRPGGCEEVFLAADGEALGYGELAALVVPLAERAEKTAVFFGHDDFSACIHGVDDEVLYARALNLLSHGQYAIYEPREMVEDTKALFRQILAAFLERYRFALPELEAAGAA